MANTKFTITTTAANETASFYLAGDGGSASISVDWGDESSVDSKTISTSSSQFSHTYATIGTYTAEITVSSGSARVWRSNSVVSASANITDIDTGDGLTKIGKYSFYNTSAFNTAKLGDSVTTIEEQAFYKSKIKHLIIGDGCTTIGAQSFDLCTALEDVVIGSGITSIDDNAFGGCTALTTIEVHAATPPSITGTSFDGVTNLNTIYVPSEYVDTYKGSDWATYADIEAIPEPEPPTPPTPVDPDDYDPDSIENTPGDADPEQALSGEAIKDIIKAYGKNLKYIKTENNTIAVNDPRPSGLSISSDDLVIRRFHGYDFIECKSYDPFFRKVYYSLIRVNDIRTFVIAANARDQIDAFRC